MRHTPRYLMTDPAEVRRLIAEHPWATLVSPTRAGLVASHYPVLLDPTRPSEGAEAGEDIWLVSHVGRPDDELHELGRHEVLVIVQGPHDYISPSWYDPGELVPTWNHVTAHLYGRPEILSADENYAMLSHLTDHFEQHHPGGRSLAENEPDSRRQAMGTVGIRLRVDRCEARAKLSQNKNPQVAHRIIDEVGRVNPELAAEMRRAHDGGAGH